MIHYVIHYEIPFVIHGYAASLDGNISGLVLGASNQQKNIYYIFLLLIIFSPQQVGRDRAQVREEGLRLRPHRHPVRKK